MVQHSREEKKNQVIQRRAELEAKLEKIRQHERKIRDRQENGPPLTKKRKLDDGNNKETDIVDDEQFALDDYESDDEGTKTSDTNDGNAELGLSKETQALMQKLGYGISALPKAEDMEAEDELKIYFCSRTHSQLSQFVNELRRIDLPAAIPAVQEEIKKNSTLSEELKHMSLGSRKNLCINAKVSSLKSMTAVNERCLELQDAKTPKEKKCPFVPNKENEGSVLDFQHHALAKIRDIEDLGVLGKKLGVCPYYATRPAVKPSEVSATLAFSSQLPRRQWINKLTTSNPDRHITISTPPPKECSGSLGPVAEEPHRHHRRSSQPHGRNLKHPHRRSQPATIASRPRSTNYLPPTLPQPTQRQKSRLRYPSSAITRLNI
jgi:chromosome transmission fidelity protein 1